jgi:nucleotide-binding universal stress UspA family protein
MMPLRKILVPVDFSELSETAVRYAAALARPNQSAITLLHVQPAHALVRGVGAAAGSTPDASEGQPDLRQFDAVMPDDVRDLSPQAIVSSGEPSREIVRYVKSEAVDLVVMPTHGYSPFHRVFLGSVTARVLDEVNCPVLTGCHMQIPSGQQPRFSNIVCALDLGSRSSDILAWAADFTRLLGSRLFLLTAVPALGSVEAEYLPAAHDNEIASRATEQLAQLREAAGIAAKLIVVGGSIATAIKRQVLELRADLLVIGRGTATGVMGRLRSNAYEIIRDSACPVLSV